MPDIAVATEQLRAIIRDLRGQVPPPLKERITDRLAIVSRTMRELSTECDNLEEKLALAGESVEELKLQRAINDILVAHVEDIQRGILSVGDVLDLARDYQTGNKKVTL